MDLLQVASTSRRRRTPCGLALRRCTGLPSLNKFVRDSWRHPREHRSYTCCRAGRWQRELSKLEAGQEHHGKELAGEKGRRAAFQ